MTGMSALLVVYLWQCSILAVQRTKYAGLKEITRAQQGIYLRVCRIGSSVSAV